MKQEAKKLAVELIDSNYEEDEAETSYRALLLLNIIVNTNHSFVSENVERVLENMLLIIRVGGKVGYVNSEYHHASTHMKPQPLLLDTHCKMFPITMSGCVFGPNGQAE